MKATNKVQAMVLVVLAAIASGCNETKSKPNLCHDLSFKPVAFSFDYNGGASGGQIVMKVDLQTDKVQMEKNDGAANVCSYTLTRAESDELREFFVDPITVCQAYADHNSATQRVLGLVGEQQNQSESVAQPDNNVLKIKDGYDKLEGILIQLSDKIKREGDCTSSSSVPSSPNGGPDQSPGGSEIPGGTDGGGDWEQHL